MTTATLFAALRERGVNLAAIGGRLRVDAPRGVLTPELRATLSAHKAEMLAMLAPTPPESEPCEHVTDPEPAAWYRENPHLTCARCWLAGRKSLWPQ